MYPVNLVFRTMQLTNDQVFFKVTLVKQMEWHFLQALSTAPLTLNTQVAITDADVPACNACRMTLE